MIASSRSALPWLKDLLPLGHCDDELMVRVQNGDAQAFAILVDRHLDAIYGFVFRILHNAADADDVVQDTFLRIWDRGHTYRPGQVRFTTWLHQIARNLAVDGLRRRRRANEEEFHIESTPSVLGSSPTPDPLEFMKLALNELPERQRTALALCTVQGMSNGEAAEVLGVSVKAVESLLSRARAKLRTAWSAGEGSWT